MRVRHSDAMSAGPTPVFANIGHGTARILRSLSVSTIALLAILLLAVILFTVAPRGYEGTIYPDVQIAGIAVGGLSEAAAQEHVQSRTSALAEQPVTLSVDGHTWTARPADLGITFDADQSVDAAMAYGRNADFASESLDGTSRNGRSNVFPLSIQFDADQFHAYLDRIEAKHGTKPLDATVTIDGTDVLVTPSQDGLVIDRTTVQTEVLDQITMLQPVTVTVPLQRQAAAITTEHATATKAVIDQALAKPATLTLGDQQWTITPAELAAAVRVGPDAGGSLAVTLDHATLEPKVAEIAKDVDAEPTDA